MSCFCKFDHVHSFKVRATNSTNAYASVSFLARTIVTGTSCEHNLHQSVWSRALRSFTGLVRHSLHVVYWETDICGHDSCRVTVKMVTQCNARRSNHSIPTLHSRRFRCDITIFSALCFYAWQWQCFIHRMEYPFRFRIGIVSGVFAVRCGLHCLGFVYSKHNWNLIQFRRVIIVFNSFGQTVTRSYRIHIVSVAPG